MIILQGVTINELLEKIESIIEKSWNYKWKSWFQKSFRKINI